MYVLFDFVEGMAVTSCVVFSEATCLFFFRFFLVVFCTSVVWLTFVVSAFDSVSFAEDSITVLSFITIDFSVVVMAIF